MATFIRPSAITRVSRSYAGHIANRANNPGVDYAAPTGTDVRAPASGTVTVGYSSIVGYWIHIDHDGAAKGWSSDLLHLSKNLVKKGAYVRQGQHIAESGGTGSAATGPHLHWSLRKTAGYALMNKKNVNGEAYLTMAAATPASNIRKTKTVVVNCRQYATTKSAVKVVAKASTSYVMVGWARGETVSGNNIWFKLKSGVWAWSGAFTSTSVTGLAEIKTGQLPPVVVTPPVVTPPASTELATVKAQLVAANAKITALNAIIAAVKKAVS